MDPAQVTRARADLLADQRKYDAARELIAEFDGFGHVRIAEDGDLEVIDDANQESGLDFAERIGGERCAWLVDRLSASLGYMAPFAIEMWDLQVVDAKAQTWRAGQRTD